MPRIARVVAVNYPHHIIQNREKSYLIDDGLLNELITNCKDFLNTQASKEEIALLKMQERTARPLGDNSFIEKLEQSLKLRLKKKKPGPKGRGKNDN